MLRYWTLNKAISKDFALVLVYTIWLIASLLFFETLDERLTAADFERTASNILGLALEIAAVAPYLLLTIKTFRVSIKVEHGKIGIQRAFIALGFMVFCCAVIIFIWTAKNDDYVIYLLKLINEPNYYTLAVAVLIPFWIYQIHHELVKSYDFSLSSIGMGFAVACHLFFFILYYDESAPCVGGVCDGMHVGAQITVLSFVGIFVILTTYMTRDWLRFRADEFHPAEGNMIIQAYAQHMLDHPISTEVLDEKLLPYPKEKILKAICWGVSLSDEKMQNNLSAGAIFLANYQKGVGPKPLYSLGRSGREILDLTSEMETFFLPDGTLDPSFGVDQVKRLMVSQEERELWLKFQSLVEKDIQRILENLETAKNKYKLKAKPLGE